MVRRILVVGLTEHSFVKGQVRAPSQGVVRFAEAINKFNVFGFLMLSNPVGHWFWWTRFFVFMQFD